MSVILPTGGAIECHPLLFGEVYGVNVCVCALFQICQMLQTAGTVRTWSTAQQVPYLVYNSNQWVGYDDADSLTGKVSSKWSFIHLR